MSMSLIEVCLDDIEGAIVSERAGADRIELCADLSNGGITPSIGTVSTVFTALTSMTVMVLIRPRAGDFVYSLAEADAMIADIRSISKLPRAAGVELGFVIGALTPSGTVDEAVSARLVAACSDHPITFHKAFDLTLDQGAALETLISLGIGRVLTSGGAADCLAGASALKALVDQAGDRIRILAGGGVRSHNAREIIQRTGVTELHFRAPKQVASLGFQGGISSVYDSALRTVTSEESVREMRAVVATS